jgi:hypothetical protein
VVRDDATSQNLAAYMKANKVPPGPEIPNASSDTSESLRGLASVILCPMGFQSDVKAYVV